MRLFLPAGAFSLLSLALSAASAQAAAPACSPLTFGAVGDGVTDSTAAIQSAIDACEASYGGGVIRLSAEPGRSAYLTGPIHLASHIRLQLDKGVTLLGTTDHSKYSAASIKQPFSNNEALISAHQAVDTGIVGPGTIDGQGGLPALDGGPSWWELARKPGADAAAHPWLLEFDQCKGVTVNDVTLTNAPMAHLVLRDSHYITVSELAVQVTPDPSIAKTDGIVVAGSSDATLIFLNLNSGGDAVALKSGTKPGASSGGETNKAGPPQQPTHDIQIVNSRFANGNGIVVGSAGTGGVYNVTATNITGTAAAHGLQIKADGTGGDHAKGDYNIWVENMTLTDVGQPLSISAEGVSVEAPAASTSDPAGPNLPNIHDITLKNVTASGATQASRIIGVPGACIRNVVLDHVKITTSGAGLQLRNMTGTFTDTVITSEPGSQNFEGGENVSVTAIGVTPAIAEGSPTTCSFASDN